MSLPSLKKEIISRFACAPTVDQLKDNKLIIVTPFGIIIGSLASEIFDINFDDSDQVNLAVMEKLTQNIIIDYRKSNSIDDNQSLEGNDGCIPLVDVVIKSSTATFNLPFLNVFYDQIIGVTIGNMQLN